MQSSVRSTAPRPTSRRSASNTSIEVAHEVSIVSTRANSMKEASRKNMVSWSPSAMGGPRAQTSDGRSSSPDVPMHRGNRSASVTRLLSRSQSANGLRPAEPDMDLLESNRESMRELSEFLRTKVNGSCKLYVQRICKINLRAIYRTPRLIIGCRSRTMKRIARSRSLLSRSLDAGAAARLEDQDCCSCQILLLLPRHSMVLVILPSRFLSNMITPRIILFPTSRILSAALHRLSSLPQLPSLSLWLRHGSQAHLIERRPSKQNEMEILRIRLHLQSS